MSIQKKLLTLTLLTIILASCNASSNINAENNFPKATLVQKSELFSLTEGKLFNLKLDKENIDKIIEPSGVVAVDDEGKYLMVIDDKSDGDRVENLRIFTETGEFVTKLKIKQADKKPKWEALAKDDDGNFYVIGSHAGDSEEKVKKRATLFRFRLLKDGETFKIDEGDKKTIKFDLTNSLKTLQIDGKNIYDEKPGSEENQKAKIEGLAFRTIENKKYLVIGFREPDSLVRVYLAEIPNELNEPVNLNLKPYFQFDAGKTEDGTKFKLSSLEYVPQMKGFLVLTSSETTIRAQNGKPQPVFHGNGIWFISDENINSVSNGEGFKSVGAKNIKEFQKENKAEGLCLIPNLDQTKFKFAIVFDNDTADMIDANVQNPPLGMMEIVELTPNK